jgi:hypothetical protein
MRGLLSARISIVALTAVIGLTMSAGAQDKSAEEDLGVHRIQTKTTAPFDAAAYLNRIAVQPIEGESPVQYGGAVIFSRLKNIEGRIQVKILDGFDADAYFGMKTFLLAWDDQEFSSGACVVCHTPTTFKSDKKFVVDESGEAKAVPSLRDLKKSDSELEKIVRGKMAMAEKAKAGGTKIDEAYQSMDLKDNDVKQLVSFIQSLNSVSKEEFRQIIVDAEILDTTSFIEASH